MTSSTLISQIPKTGRIGRFAKILETACPEQSFLKIMSNTGKYNSLKPQGKALWWKQAMSNLENELGTKAAIKIMKECGNKCCGKGQRDTAKKLMDESVSIKEFLKKVSLYGVKEGEIDYELINNNVIIGKHNRCFCGLVKKSDDNFPNSVYCQCSVEFNKQFFQAAFNKVVEVELKQSILTGGSCCEFKIKILE